VQSIIRFMVGPCLLLLSRPHGRHCPCVSCANRTRPWIYL